MSTRYRLSQIAEQVKQAGLDGKSMTDELSKVAERYDLSADEIDRVAEMANREVQLGLYKTSQDKRFKFDLARPGDVKKTARKKAESPFISSVTTFDKVASMVDETGGDPFASPNRPTDDLSLYQYDLGDERARKLAYEQQDVADREMMFKLDKARLETEAMLREGNGFDAKYAAEAVKDHKAMIQSALDMLSQGVTLPDLFEAICAGMSGSTTTEADKEAPLHILRLLIAGLKERGVANYQMGFRHHGDPEALDKLTEDQLYDRCLASCVYTKDKRNAGTIMHDEVKTAGVYAEHATTALPELKGQQNLSEDALELLKKRPSVMDHEVPKVYLDHADNLENGKPRVVNGENEFVVAVKNLVGDQTRLLQVHGAQEYLGLKLKQIEEAIQKLRQVRSAEEDKIKDPTQGNG